MTDFSTELLPDEEEKVDEVLPTQDDAIEAKKAIETPVDSIEASTKPLSTLGNAALAQHLANPTVATSTGTDPAADVTTHTNRAAGTRNEKVAAVKPSPDNASELAGTRAPASDKNQESAGQPEARADPAEANPLAQRQGRRRLLMLTLSRLLTTPETAPVDALFTAFLSGAKDEQSAAALAIANAVLRIDADNRRRARIVLANAMRAHKMHPLAQILAIRLGAWVSTPPAPEAAPEPGGDP